MIPSKVMITVRYYISAYIAVNYMTQCHQQHIEKCPVTWYR